MFNFSLVTLDYFRDASIQIGDKAFYVLKEADFADNPTLARVSSSVVPSSAEASGGSSAAPKVQPRGSRSRKNNREFTDEEEQCKDEGSLEVTNEEQEATSDRVML